MNSTVSRIPINLTITLIAFFMLILTGCSQHETEQKNGPLDNTAAAVSESQQRFKDVAPDEAVEENDETADEEESTEESEEDDDFEEFDEFEEEFGDASESRVLDPFEGYNRAMTTVNDKLYFWVLDPIARGYRWLLPETVRQGVANFFHNLLYPVRFVNNVLQLKFRNALEETIRFSYNTTFGLLGVWDPGREWIGLTPHEEDFGQTLGFYGVGSGPHIVLPILGPSNLRDTISLYPDNYVLDPKVYYIEGTERQIGVFAFEKVNEVSLRIGEYDSIKKDAIDFYLFLRDGYESMRIKEIKE